MDRVWAAAEAGDVSALLHTLETGGSVCERGVVSEHASFSALLASILDSDFFVDMVATLDATFLPDLVAHARHCSSCKRPCTAQLVKDTPRLPVCCSQRGRNLVLLTTYVTSCLRERFQPLCGRMPCQYSLVTSSPSRCRSASLQDGDAPLHYATEEGHTEVVRLLLASGATPTQANQVRWIV
jgi:hypothetical protein